MDGERTKKTVQSLIKRIKSADWKDCDKDYMARLAEERIGRLQQSGVYCVDRFVQKLAKSVGDKEQYLDILMEGRFAIILARNGFKEIYIAYCSQGPDIKAEYNRQTIYFEVTRRHAAEDEWTGEFGAAGLSPERPEDVVDKIRHKLGQLEDGKVNIVVLASDRANLGKRDVEGAAILQELCNHSRFGDLSGVLFTESGGGKATSFCLFKNDRALRQIGTRLHKKLKSLSEVDSKELQKKMDEMADALRRSFNK